MLRWAIIFLILAVVAALLGFSGAVAGTLMWAAQLCAILFVILFVVSLMFGNSGVNPPGPYV